MMRGRAASAVMVCLVLAGCGVTSAASQATSGSGGGAGAGAAATTPPAKQYVPVSDLLNPASGKFFGLEINGAPDSMSPVQTVDAEVSKTPNLIGQYVEWNKPFDVNAANNALDSSSLYFMSWEPFNTTVSAIADGDSDSYITQFARSVRAFGKPVALSFGHEFNGNWYPWGTSDTSATEFVAAWRHIHDLFAQAGATNVIWVWNANVVNPMPDVELEPYWPGDSYVDWVGITGYFATTGPHTFDGLYGPTMTEIKQFTAKPFIIAETSVETGPDETESAQALVSGVKETSDVLGFIWFDYNKDGVDWTLEGRPSVRAAVAGSLSGLPLVNLIK